MELWQKQIIRKLFHYSAKHMDIEGGFQIKHPHVPDRLYKYRAFKSEHLDALNDSVLWMSSPDRLNDPHEATVNFDPDRFLVEDQSPQEFINTARTIERNVEAGGKWQFEKPARPISSGELRRRHVAELLKNADIPHKDELVQASEGFAQQMAKDNIKRMSDNFRRGFSVLSLSATPTENLMWTHYSDEHRGFIIEYDFASLPSTDLRKRLCFPVFYTKKPRDATRYLMHHDLAPLS